VSGQTARAAGERRPARPARDPAQGPSPDELGQRLRAAREAHGISLRALAKRIDVSPSFISQVELGRASPSVGTLYSLVTALGLSLDDVMTEEPEAQEPPARPEPPAWAPPSPERSDNIRPRIGQHVQRAAGRRVIKMSGVTWERLTHDDDPLVDFLSVTYAPGSASCPEDDLMRHGGREYGHVISGRIRIQVGFETYELAPGDSIHFDSATPHRLSNPFDEPCVGLWVVVGRQEDGQAAATPASGSAHLPALM
jgi:transcriptional regulator with XRE-family HTH domain